MIVVREWVRVTDMTMMTSLKADRINAMKSKDEITKNLLTALIGEATSVGKNDGDRETTDAEIVAVVKKFIKNAEETKTLSLQNGRDVTLAEKELEILMKMVPVQMTETSLKAVLEDYKKKNTDAKLGDGMKYLKENYAGLYDGKLASKVCKEVF